MALTRKQATDFISSLLALRDGATDALASTATFAYPTLETKGALIKAGTRINWNGTIKKASADLWDTAENNPENAPSLWEDLEYRDGYRFIPETITVTSAFAKGERGWWMDNLYESLLDANVYTPTAYPAGWKIVE